MKKGTDLGLLKLVQELATGQLDVRLCDSRLDYHLLF